MELLPSDAPIPEHEVDRGVVLTAGGGVRDEIGFDGVGVGTGVGVGVGVGVVTGVGVGVVCTVGATVDAPGWTVIEAATPFAKLGFADE